MVIFTSIPVPIRFLVLKPMELGLREFGEDLNRIFERVILAEVSDREGAPISFALFFCCHVDSLRCERPGGLPR